MSKHLAKLTAIDASQLAGIKGGETLSADEIAALRKAALSGGSNQESALLNAMR